MEDHLKNKNRLEKEWEALCAYQAEPNSSFVAQREENLPKNRCPAVLTCTYRPAPGRGWRGPGRGCAGLAPGSPLGSPATEPSLLRICPSADKQFLLVSFFEVE